jgi:hypothetical protein
MEEGFVDVASKGKDLPVCLIVDRPFAHQQCSLGNLDDDHSSLPSPTNEDSTINTLLESPDSGASDKLFDFETAFDSAFGDLPFLVRITMLCLIL